MKKIVAYVIFSCLMIFSLQQMVFADTEDNEERAEKAAEARAQTLAEAARAEKAAVEAERAEKAAVEAERAEREKEKEKAQQKLKREIIKDEVKEKEKIVEEPIVRKIPSKLIKLLPTENKLDEITLRTIWKYVDKQSAIDEEVQIETMTALLRDITRVYDPIINKYKVSTIQIEIIKYEDKYEFEYYWEEISNYSVEEIFNNAYLIGSPDQNIDCMFNFTEKGAVTICKTDEYLVQSTIFDKYQEHFSYNKLKIGPKKLHLNQDEMTTRIVQEILKNIEINKNIENENEAELYKILKLNREIKEMEIKSNQKISDENEENNIKIKKENYMNEEQYKNKLLGIEKDKKYGIQNFSCSKDEFSLITISGQFNNNEIKKDKVVLEILFLDNKQNIIFKNNANLLNIGEYEIKRFLGNAKINESFSTCTIKMNN